jgi:hypothetical protein
MSNRNIIVLIDGKPVSFQNDVKIIFPGVYVGGSTDDNNNELHLSVNSEGLVTDVVREGEVIGTQSYMADSLVEMTGVGIDEDENQDLGAGNEFDSGDEEAGEGVDVLINLRGKHTEKRLAKLTQIADGVEPIINPTMANNGHDYHWTLPNKAKAGELADKLEKAGYSPLWDGDSDDEEGDGE